MHAKVDTFHNAACTFIIAGNKLQVTKKNNTTKILQASGPTPTAKLKGLPIDDEIVEQRLGTEIVK